MIQKRELNKSIRTTDVPVVDLLTHLRSNGKCGGRAQGLETERVIRELCVELVKGDCPQDHDKIESGLTTTLMSRQTPPRLQLIILRYLKHGNAALTEVGRNAVRTFEKDERNVEVVFEYDKHL